MININDHSTHWKTLATRDWKTAQALYEVKRYDACLFFCHLCLEKILKGIVMISTRKEAPFIHDLERLAILAGLNLNSDQITDLKSISAFNIAGRYSDYKFVFYKKCTRIYTQKYLSKTKELFLCLKRKYPNR